MRPWLAALLLVAILVSPILPGTGLKVGSQSSGYLLVFPFFLQQTPSGLGVNDIKYAGVNITFYNSLYTEVVVDLNHNGVADPGEPSISISGSKDRVYSVFIGYSSTPCVKPDIKIEQDIGPLWIIVSNPVLAKYVWVSNKGGDSAAAYGMPYPSKALAVPPFPGNIYVTPATPDGATISYGGRNISLQPGQYLIIPHDGRGFKKIVADKPITGVLIHLGDGYNDTYATELYPPPGHISMNTLGNELSSEMLAARFPSGETLEPDVYRASWTNWGKELTENIYTTNRPDTDGTYYYIRYRLGDHISSAAFVRFSGKLWINVFSSDWGDHPLGAYLRTALGVPASGGYYRVLIPSYGGGDTYFLYDYGNDGTFEVASTVDKFWPAITPRAGSVDGVIYLSEDGVPVIMEGDDGLNQLMAGPAGYGLMRADADMLGKEIGVLKKSGYKYVPAFTGPQNPIDSISWHSCAPGTACPVNVKLKESINTSYYLIVFNTTMIPLNGVEVGPGDAGKNVRIINATAPLHNLIRVYAVGEVNGELLSAGVMHVEFKRFDDNEAHPSIDPDKGVPGTGQVTPPQAIAPITAPEGSAEVIGDGYREAQLKDVTLNLGWAREVVNSFQQTGQYTLPETPAIGRQECGTETTTSATTTATLTTTATASTTTTTAKTTTQETGTQKTTTTHTTENLQKTTTATQGSGLNTTTLAMIGAVIVAAAAIAVVLLRR